MGDLTIRDLPFIMQMMGAGDSTVDRLFQSGLFGPEDIPIRAQLHLVHVTRDEATLLELARGSEFPDVRCGVLRNPAVTAAVVAQLARDRTFRVSELAASSELLPLAEMERIACEADVAGQAAGLAMNLFAPARLLVLLAGHPRSIVRSRVAGNANTPVSVAEILASDPEATARAGAARHPYISGETRDRLARDADPMPRAVSAGQDLSAFDSLHLSRDPDRLVRYFAACNQSVTAEMADALARPGEQLGVLRQLAANTAVTAAVLDRMSRWRITGGWVIRQAVCGNTSASEATLLRLAHGDRARHIRDHAARMLAWRLGQKKLA